MTAVSASDRLRSLSGREPGTYQRHPLHASDRTYSETNCYADIIIELLHACGYEPLAAFAHLVRMDFEGDQWTFFKPPPDDLELLYGIDIHEMQPYRPLPLQIAEQLACGRGVIVELDSWHLPDTAATSYRREHVKTSVAADWIDVDRQVLRYFHSAGLFELRDEDFRGVFRCDQSLSEWVLPPYTELVRFDAGRRLDGAELKAASRRLLAAHLARRPADNPFHRFGAQLTRVLPELLEGSPQDYHAYAFATARMAGSAFEVLATYADWLAPGTAVSTPLAEIVAACKAISFRLARRRPFDVQPLISAMGAAWERSIDGLGALAG